jgi:hypothetical protein
MTKVAGVLIALLVVGIAVTARTHTAGPVCPAAPTGRASTAAGHR